MDSDENEDGLKLAKQLKETIAISVAMVMIKKARQEGISTFQYTKNFQEKYVQENQEKLNPILKQRFVASCQDEVLEKLRKAIPEPCEPFKLCLNPQNPPKQSYDAGLGVDWLDEWCADSERKQQPKPPVQTKPPPPQQLFKAEDSALKNIKYVESMLRLSEFAEQSKLIPTSELQSLLYDEAGFRHHPQNLNFHGDHQRLTEDSGFYGSENTEERNNGTSHGVNFISGNIVRNNMQSSNYDQLMVQSAKLIVNYVKSEMTKKTFEVFCSWKQSVLEHACEILKQFSVRNEDCSEMLLDLSLDLLEDIWCDKKTSQHQVWEIKSYFVINLLSTVQNCYETLQLISEKCIVFRKAFIKKTNDYAMMAEKLYVLLHLYCSVCENLQRLKQENKDLERNKTKSEDSDVTQLWKEKWGTKTDEEEDEQEMDEMMEKQIESFEVLMISLSHKYPLLVTLLLEGVEAAKRLSSQHESSRDDDLL